MDRIADAIRDHSVGALYVVNFVFFAGASAGAIVVGTVAGASGIRHLRPLVRAAELAAIAGFFLATIFFGLGLAQPKSTWSLVREETGPTVWNLTISSLYLVNGVALGYFSARRDLICRLAGFLRERHEHDTAVLSDTALATASTVPEPRFLRALTVVLIPAAMLLHAVPAWVRAVLQTEPGWSMVTSAALFYVSTLVSGLALVVLATTASRTFLGFCVGDTVVQRLAAVLCFATPVLGFCLVAEMQTMLDASGPAGTHLFREIVAGPYATIFWFIQLGGVIVPFFLLTLPGSVTAARIGLAALLVLLGTLAERWILVVPALLGHAHFFFANGGYHPSVAEVLTTLGTYALGLLACRPLARVFAVDWSQDSQTTRF